MAPVKLTPTRVHRASPAHQAGKSAPRAKIEIASVTRGSSQQPSTRLPHAESRKHRRKPSQPGWLMY